MAQKQPELPALLSALKKISAFLERESLPYCLIGGIALQLRGAVRYTRDVDICILSTVDKLEKLIALLDANFSARFSGGAKLAISTQIFPIVIDNVVVDLSFGLSGFEEQVIARATREILTAELAVPVCSAEDLLIFKILARREKDLLDIQELLKNRDASFDLSYVRKILAEFEKALSDSTLLKLLDEKLK